MCKTTSATNRVQAALQQPLSIGPPHRRTSRTFDLLAMGVPHDWQAALCSVGDRTVHARIKFTSTSPGCHSLEDTTGPGVGTNGTLALTIFPQFVGNHTFSIELFEPADAATGGGVVGHLFEDLVLEVRTEDTFTVDPSYPVRRQNTSWNSINYTDYDNTATVCVLVAKAADIDPKSGVILTCSLVSPLHAHLYDEAWVRRSKPNQHKPAPTKIKPSTSHGLLAGTSLETW